MSGPEIVFALARGQNAFFRDLADALVFELRRLGVEARTEIGGVPSSDRGRVTVLLPPHEFLSLSGVHLTPSLLSRCVLISAEQPTSGFFSTNAALGRSAAAVLDINPRAVRSYRAAGVEAGHLQLGYSEAWDARDGETERDIDVLFMGRTTERRERALARYADVLERFECEFVISDNRTPNVTDGASFATAKRKGQLLARSRVVLNVHGELEPYFEWLRAVEAISSGCVFVTEQSTDVAPLRPGSDLVMGSYESLGLLTAALLDDDERLRRVAESGEQRLRSEANLADAASTLLEAARRADAGGITPQAHSDAPIARAKALISTLKPRIARANNGEISEATLRLLQPPGAVPSALGPSAPRSGEVSVGEQRVLRALKRQQQELLALRRANAQHELARARPSRPDPETVAVARTPAWKLPGRPLASVIVPFYNDGDVVTEALDSVLRSTMSSWEIVIVDDGSSEGANEVIRRWMHSHRHSRALLVRHEVNRGLSASRNTGAAKARGDLLLMLDSDNLIRPFGMARLVAALRRDPGADFAYGMLDRFNSYGHEGLVSIFGWEPERLRESNYIDALAMIRRRALYELDGYSGDGRLALGLEDYDLWARMAEQGRRGAFIRRPVGSYRVSNSSMLSVTGISQIDAMAAISEHAPTLMRGVEISAFH